jgi:hypothetical protein
MRDVRAGGSDAHPRADGPSNGREEDLGSNEITLVQQRSPKGDPQTLQGIHFTGLKAISFNNRSNAGRAVVLAAHGTLVSQNGTIPANLCLF